MTTNPAVLAALEPSGSGRDTIEQIARRFLRARITEPVPARRVYLEAERHGLTAADIKAGLRRSGLRFEQIAGAWWIRPATAREKDDAKRAALARYGYR